MADRRRYKKHSVVLVELLLNWKLVLQEKVSKLAGTQATLAKRWQCLAGVGPFLGQSTQLTTDVENPPTFPRCPGFG